MDVDPLKYRLRAFEHNFVKPITSYLEEDPLLEVRARATAFWQALMTGEEEPRLGDHDAPASIGLMQACLLAEAAEWVRIGLAIGYFSSEIPPLPIGFGGIDFHEDRDLFVYISGSQYTSPEDLYWDAHRRFADDLTAATERLDDHDRHTELLRVLYFATEREWERRFGLLEDLASTLERRPDVSFSDGVMGELSWALFEPNDQSFAHPGIPSGWRNTSRFSVPTGGMARERVGQLSAVRKRIAAACEKVGSGDETSASVLLAAVLENERGGLFERSRGDWPLMFSRVNEEASRRTNLWF